MVYRIIQYIQPWEIDDLERQLDQLIKSSYYIEKQDKVIVDVTMNTSIVDWNKSKLPVEFFINKFNYLCYKTGLYFEAEFDTDVSIQGACDKKRTSCKKEHDFSIFLDSDLFFSYLTLPYIISSSKSIKEKLFIITPEIIRYWDSTWDVITNRNFLNEPNNHRDYFDMYCLDSISQDVSLRSIDTLKFGAGWFTLMNKALTDLLPLPEELGSYGHDDSFVMVCGSQVGVKQFVLEGVIVSEIGQTLLNNKDYIKSLLYVIIKDKSKISDLEFLNLANTFINNLQST